MDAVESTFCFLSCAIEYEVAGRTYVRTECASHLEAFDWFTLVADGFGTVIIEGVPVI